jgi:hypothetical protein
MGTSQVRYAPALARRRARVPGPAKAEGPALFRAGPSDWYFSGVSDGIRTHDIQDHNLAL